MTQLDSDVRAGFVRQRRNLNVTSLGLVLLVTAGISLKEISILGNTFELKRPEALPAAFWLAWAYFLVRYYQYLRDLQDSGPRAAYERRLERLIIERAT